MINKEELVKEEKERQKGFDDLTQKGWLTIPNAAKYADYSKTIIYAWLKDPINPLPSSKKNGRRINRKKLDQYIEQYEQNRMF